MLGYYKNEEATKDMVKEDGWLHTGQLSLFFVFCAVVVLCVCKYFNF